MLTYWDALNTSLGDWLSLKASQQGITRSELEKRVTIEPISVFSDGDSQDVIEELNNFFKERNYSAVVEFRENSYFDSYLKCTCCLMRGTGVIVKEEL